ncbi:PQ loop repeat-domain-containing protein [Ilyonectria destructans]|nr:PQ loop repeat-domain-containing protein [Ilyonectria destructans]
MLVFDLEAASGIFGAMSIACWTVVFTPQILQNFKRKNADALSLHFIIIWLVGDIFNIIGSVLQGVLTSMIILAVYYTVADLVLLGQMFFYRGYIFRKPSTPSTNPTALVEPYDPNSPSALSVEPYDLNGLSDRRGSDTSDVSSPVPDQAEVPAPKAPRSLLQRFMWNTIIILMVLTAGFIGWLISVKISGQNKDEEIQDEDSLEFNTTGQVFGYLGAVTYIASRLPQLYLNWKRKTTEGLAMLFFIFSCLGNVTYVLSIFAYDPHCAGKICKPGEASRVYGRYILINLSWLGGSIINLLEDCGVFSQYFMYRNRARLNPNAPKEE